MKNFSLVENDGNLYPEMPRGLVVVFGYKRDAVAFMDYDGKMDRPTPEKVNGDTFPLCRDQDSIMAWHGERKKINNTEYVKVVWQKPRKRYAQ